MSITIYFVIKAARMFTLITILWKLYHCVSTHPEHLNHNVTLEDYSFYECVSLTHLNALFLGLLCLY